MKNRLVSECLKAFTKRQRRILYALMALTVLLGLIFPLLLSSDPRSVMTLSRAYRPGELSDEDVIAPSDFSYIDDAATADDTAEAARSVLPQFYYSISDSMEIVMEHPVLFNTAVKAAPLVDALPRPMIYSKLNAWGEGREMPQFAKESFNSLWKKGKVK